MVGCPHQESNLDLLLRTELFYPLNYGGARTFELYHEFCYACAYMTPEEKSLLERTYKMSEENNSILRKMRRAGRVVHQGGVSLSIRLVGHGHPEQPYQLAAGGILKMVFPISYFQYHNPPLKGAGWRVLRAPAAVPAFHVEHRTRQEQYAPIAGGMQAKSWAAPQVHCQRA